MGESIVPGDPLEFIQKCMLARRVLWTYHVTMRMKGRFIPRQIILEAVSDYEIIESYPEDKYLPSYLLHVRHDRINFHVLVAIDKTFENIRIITAYYPDPEKWSEDFRRRKTT